MYRTIPGIVISCSTLYFAVALFAATPPRVVGPVESHGRLLILPSGLWQAYAVRDAAGTFQLVREGSGDEGRSWSDAQVLTALPGAGWGGVLPLLDSHGELQIILTRRRGEGKEIAVNRFIDLWHIRSIGKQTYWSSPQRVFEGYVGSIQEILQLSNGRIVLPFAAWIAGRPSGPPTGPNETTVAYSDDDGATWKQSPSHLTAPCVAGYNGSNYGAIEPAILQLQDGRVWMLMRTQTGFLYESFSRDGIEWSAARSSRFVSSTSPAFLLRLRDHRIVLFWNNAVMPPRVDEQGVYGGRDVLHAAISSDDGATWRGYREVYRDPYRNDPPPKTGDRGTAYPYAAETADGRIALVSGQGAGRRALILIDPSWLLETRAETHFEDGLAQWCVFQGVGPASGWWRNRIAGAQLVPDPGNGGRRVLRVSRTSAQPGGGAVWNFPMGWSGELSIDLRLERGFGGAALSLDESFFDPADDAGLGDAVFRLPIPDSGVLGAAHLESGKWHKVTLRWDAKRHTCAVLVDGASVVTLSAGKAAAVSYLRVRSTAPHPDPAGMLVAGATVAVKP